MGRLTIEGLVKIHLANKRSHACTSTYDTLVEYTKYIRCKILVTFIELYLQKNRR